MNAMDVHTDITPRKPDATVRGVEAAIWNAGALKVPVTPQTFKIKKKMVGGWMRGFKKCYLLAFS